MKQPTEPKFIVRASRGGRGQPDFCARVRDAGLAGRLFAQLVGQGYALVVKVAIPAALVGCMAHADLEPVPPDLWRPAPGGMVAPSPAQHAARLGDLLGHALADQRAAQQAAARPAVWSLARPDAGEPATDAGDQDAAQDAGEPQRCPDAQPLLADDPHPPIVVCASSCLAGAAGGYGYCTVAHVGLVQPQPPGGCCDDQDCGGDVSGWACVRRGAAAGSCAERCRL